MNAKVIEIYWDDLTEEKKKEIIDICGDNNNWDVFPICSITTDRIITGYISEINASEVI